MSEILRKVISKLAEKEVEKLLQELIKGTEFANKAFSVGGFVRDELLGIPSKDLDVVVEMKDGAEKFTKFIHDKFPEEVSTPHNMGKGYPIWAINFKRDVVHKGKKYETKGADLEVADTQKESFPDPKTRQRVTEHGTIIDDIARRDFTVNMLLRDLTTGEIKDLTGTSKKDLEKGVLRGHPEVSLNKTFSDDPLRMLRLVRFQVKYGWDVPLAVIKIVKKNAKRIEIMSGERIREELDKIMKLGKMAQATKFMKVTGLLKYMLPEIDKLKDKSNGEPKGDVLKNTLEVLKKTKPGVESQLAALLSDVEDTDDLASSTAEKILKKLKYNNKTIQKVRNTIKHKTKPENSKDWSVKKVREFIREVGEELEDILDLAESKSKTKNTKELREKIKEVLKIPVNKSSILNGKEVMELLDVKGQDVGKALSMALEIEDEMAEKGEKATKDKVKEELKKKFKK